MSAAGAVDRADGRSLRTGFLEHAARTPDAPALWVDDRTLTYADLERRARTWAGAIVGRLGRPAARVAILGQRSEIAYAGALAALCAGAAFVPLNPRFPLERTRAMLEAAAPDALIADAAAVEQLGDLLTGGGGPALILMPATDASPAALADRVVLPAAALAATPPLDELPPLASDDVAYLLFTSGSTGRPKGVPVTHGNVVWFLDVVGARYDVRPSDRFSQTFDQTFDLSVFDLFLPWSRGASVYALRPLDLLAPMRFVERHALTVWFSVPSVPALMLRKGGLPPGRMPSLRWSLFCGEPLPRASAEAWQAAAPASIVENLYGPTELTIACFAYRWDPVASPAACRHETVPIGRPFPGLAAVVVAEDGRPAPIGQPGELWVSGPQTAPGYWRDPEITAERFVAPPDVADGTKRFYRTGDVVERTATGDYVYLARVDQQVKVLGHRVELAEVEAALRGAAGVVEAVAVAWPRDRGGGAQGLVAFVTGHAVDHDGALALVRTRLPDYMVPRELRVVPTLPLNANGKIDRRALLAELERGPRA
jgi:amino acid adenylation domain-containing protein